MLMNGNGLLKIFVAFVVTFKNLLPRRKNKNMVIKVALTSVVKMFWIANLRIIQIGQNIGQTSIQKHLGCITLLRFIKLIKTTLKQQFAEQQWLGQKQLLYPVLSGLQGHLSGNFIKTDKRTMFQFSDNGRFSGSRASGNDNFFCAQKGKSLGVKFGIKFMNKKCKVKCIFAVEKLIMDPENKSEAFYKKLREQLYETSSWPTEYLYKFIVPTDNDKIKKIEDLFDNLGAVITTTESKNGKYTSVSINVPMKDPDAVISKYKEVASNVEGVISL